MYIYTHSVYHKCNPKKQKKIIKKMKKKIFLIPLDCLCTPRPGCTSCCRATVAGGLRPRPSGSMRGMSRLDSV